MDLQFLMIQIYCLDFNAVAKVGKPAAKAIIDARNKKGNFTSLVDFLMKVDKRKIKLDSIRNLIHGGAFDSFGTRKGLAESLDVILKTIRNAETKEHIINENDFSNFFQTAEYPLLQLLTKEHSVLGIYISANPLKIYEKLRQRIDPTQKYKYFGILSAVKTTKTRKGDLMAFGLLSRDNGTTQRLVFFPRVYTQNIEKIKQGNIVLVSGKVKPGEDSVIVNNIINLAEESDTIETVVNIDLNCDLYAINKLKDAVKNPDKYGSTQFKLSFKLEGIELSTNMSVV